MKGLIVGCVILGTIVLAGCGNGLSNDFGKSGRYAFALVKKAEAHETVLEVEVTKAFAQAEADAKSDADKKTLDLLQKYMNTFKWNDGTPLAQDSMKACHNSLSRIFEENVAPDKAAEECRQAINAESNKKWEEEEKKRATPAPQK